MNPLEIEACIINAKTGNKEEMGKILEQFKPFIFKTARTYNIKNYELNDLAQIGYMALINAISKYKPGSHTFNSYAYNSIKNSFNYVARQNKKFIKDLSLNAPISYESNGTEEFIDCLEDIENLEEVVLKSEDIKALRSSILKLPKEEKELILSLFYGDCSIKAYAEKKEIGYLKTTRQRKKVLGKLGQDLSTRLN
jgi:RNA polymerase sigma factor (sigma-70 family)